jgi:hypothetical protein
MNQLLTTDDYEQLIDKILQDEKELHRVRKKTQSNFTREMIDKKLASFFVIKKEIHKILDLD